MTTIRIEKFNRGVWVFASVYSSVIMGIGLWVSFSTGEWIAIACALGLAVFPIVPTGWHTRYTRPA